MIEEILSKNPKFITIRKSNIPNAGRGAFTNVNIEENTYLGQYKGTVTSYYPNQYSKYIFQTTLNNNTIYIDAINKINSNWTRYMNSSNDNETLNVTAEGKKDGCIYFYTSKNVKRGDELLYYYGDDYSFL